MARLLSGGFKPNHVGSEIFLDRGGIGRDWRLFTGLDAVATNRRHAHGFQHLPKLRDGFHVIQQTVPVHALYLFVEQGSHGH